MLLAPFLLKGAVALKTLLLLNTAGWYPRNVDRRLVGPAGVYIMGCAISDSKTVQQPSADTSPGEVQVLLDPTPVILLLDATSEVLLLDAAPVTVLEVPTLDWSVPEAPTLRALKALEVPEIPSDVVTYDLYFNIIGFAPSDSLYRQTLTEEKPFVPVVPDEEAPPVWRYEYPELTFQRLCLKKGLLPSSFGYYQMLIVFSLRGFAAFWFIWSVCSWFVDYPGYLLDAWELYRERRRPQPAPPDIVDSQPNDYGVWDWD